MVMWEWLKHTVGVGIIDESELQMSKGQIWKGLKCHNHTPPPAMFLFSNDYSRVKKLEKTLEILQFSSFSWQERSRDKQCFVQITQWCSNSIWTRTLGRSSSSWSHAFLCQFSTHPTIVPFLLEYLNKRRTWSMSEDLDVSSDCHFLN